MPAPEPAKPGPSPLVTRLVEIAWRYHARRMRFGSIQANCEARVEIEALLAPVREAMEIGLAWTMLAECDDEKKMRDALASLQPAAREGTER